MESPEQRIVVFYDPRCLEHDTGAGLMELAPSPLLDVEEKHPESADRVRTCPLESARYRPRSCLTPLQATWWLS